MKKANQEIVKNTEKLQHKLEKKLDRELPKLSKDIRGLDRDLVNLYQKVEKIPPTKIMPTRTLEKRLKGVDSSNTYLFRHLLYQLAMFNYNFRMTELLLGLYDIKILHNERMLKQFNKLFRDTVKDVYKADLLKKNKVLSDEKINEVLSYRIDNVHYRRRIWQNTERLSDKLLDTFIEGLDKGMTHQQLSLAVSNDLKTAYSASVRLLKTEFTAVYNNSLLSYYLEQGIEFVRQISTLDLRTSQICRTRHLDIIAIKDAVIGENIPPLHPYCRSIIIPLF